MAKSFVLKIRGRDEFDVEAHEPFDGAAFVAHKARGDREWLVTHRGTTFIAHYPDDNTKRAALAVAEALSKSCPSADKVKQADGGKLTGPHQKLREEIVAALRHLGESLPRSAA